MKAIYFERLGNAQEVLSLGQFDKPVPKPNEVIVKLLGSTLNPADFLFIEGSYRFQPEFPQIAGLEGAGIIESTGSNVNLSTGALVSFLCKNTWAEYVAVAEQDLFVLTPEFPVDKAIQFTLNPLTAWGLLEKASLKAGDFLVVTAGNSTVAHLISQMARLRDIRVIVTVRQTAQVEQLQSAGITAIDASAEDLASQIDRLTNGMGIAAILDAVGGNTATALISRLHTNGKLIIYGRLDPAPVQFHNASLLYKNISVTTFGIRGYLESKSGEDKAAMAQSLMKVIGDPSFKMDVAAHYPLELYQEAVRASLEKNIRGKVIFKV